MWWINNILIREYTYCSFKLIGTELICKALQVYILTRLNWRLVRLGVGSDSGIVHKVELFKFLLKRIVSNKINLWRCNRKHERQTGDRINGDSFADARPEPKTEWRTKQRMLRRTKSSSFWRYSSKRERLDAYWRLPLKCIAYLDFLHVL